MTDGIRKSEEPPLVEGVDYNADALGRWVFTAGFLRRRGFCCFLACTHCPFGQAGRDPRAAAADLRRRLRELGTRLTAAGMEPALLDYRNGTLHIRMDGHSTLDSHRVETRILDLAAGLLTVLRLEWE